MVRRYRPRRIALGVAVLVLAGCVQTAMLLRDRPPPLDLLEVVEAPELRRDSLRVALRAAGTFAVTLSARPDTLAPPELVVLDPDVATVDDVRALRRAGSLTLAYVNVGEREAYRPWAGRVDTAWTLADNPDWPGHTFVDAREPGWQELVRKTAVRRALGIGADGVFLDMLDVAEAVPETRPGMLALVRAIRADHPERLVVANRGLALLPELDPALDGLLVESVWARTGADGVARATDPEERDRLVAALRGFRERTGGAALALDYPGDVPGLADAARAGARAADLPIFLGRRSLGAAPAP